MRTGKKTPKKQQLQLWNMKVTVVFIICSALGAPLLKHFKKIKDAAVLN